MMRFARMHASPSRRGFAALLSVLIVMTALVAIAAGASLQGLYAREDTADRQAGIRADAAARGCGAIAALEISEGTSYPRQITIGSVSCAVTPEPEGSMMAQGRRGSAIRSYRLSYKGDGVDISETPVTSLPP